MANLKDIPTPRLQAIRTRARELPEGNFIISIDNPKEHTTAGKIFVADALTTAGCEYDMTHRLCKAEEIEAYLKEEQAQREAYAAREVARRANFNVNVTVPAQEFPVNQPSTPTLIPDIDLRDTSDSKGLPKKVK